MVMLAARKYASASFGVPILTGNAHKIKITPLNLKISPDQIGIIDPTAGKDSANFEERMYVRPAFQAVQQMKIRELALEPNYFSANDARVWTCALSPEPLSRGKPHCNPS